MSEFTRIFFATDIHGSEICFKKFVNAAKFYKADVLVLGGDVTGKMIVPVVETDNEEYHATLLGQEQTAKSKTMLETLQKKIRDSGFYPYLTTQSEFEELNLNKSKVNDLFRKLMCATLTEWTDYAEKVLKDSNVVCYMTGGNDDAQEVIDVIEEKEHVKNPDGKVVLLDQEHEMASLGWSNETPWKTPRETSEEQLEKNIKDLLSRVGDFRKCVFNFHVPPIDSTLDLCPKLDTSVYPPKPILEGGQYVMIGAGSTSVRNALETHQPLLDLCGHIHESRGINKIGRTICINPGSEYGQGILRGAIANIKADEVVSYQLTAG